MKPFDQLTSRQKFWRQNIARYIIYGSFAAVLLWSMFWMVRLQEQANTSVQHVEDVMVDYYRETIGRKDTVGMAAYIKQHLSPDEYQIWLQMGE